MLPVTQHLLRKACFLHTLAQAWCGIRIVERGGRVIVEMRLDGTMAIRFQKHYLKFGEVVAGTSLGGSAPKPPEFKGFGGRRQ